MIEVRHPQIKILRSGNNVVYCRLLCVPVLFFWEAKQRNIAVGKSVCAAYSCANLPTLRLALSHDAVAVPLVTRGASSGAITDYAPTSSLSKYSLFGNGLVLSCTILCSTAFCRLSNDSQRRITQRIDVDGAAYRLHGQKLAGIAFNRAWNNVGETASAAAAGNRFHSGMVRATNDPWSCAVTAPMAQNLK